MTPAPSSTALATDAVASIAADYESSCPIVYRELIDPALGRMPPSASGAPAEQGDVTGILVAALCEIQAQLPKGSTTPAYDPAAPAPDSARVPITQRSTPWPLATGTRVGTGAGMPRRGPWQDVSWEQQSPFWALPQGDRGAATQRLPRRGVLAHDRLLLAVMVLVALLGLGALAYLKLLAPHA
ncbi:MAG: hypothetical protein WKG00_31165 [Polyangiaceae bacterium]